MGVSPSKIKFWPQWAEGLFGDPSALTKYNDDLIPTNGFIIMFAGNIGNAQDFETIVEAAILLKHREDIQFVILGDGLKKNWASEEIKKNNVEKTFHFLGRKPVEAMPYYYSKADVMLASLTDSELFAITIPAKVQSYLASGKPILAAINGEGGQIVDEWKAGFSCPATQPKKLAETIEKMAALSKSELEQMGKNALACYHSEFEREKLISSLIEEFNKL